MRNPDAHSETQLLSRISAMRACIPRAQWPPAERALIAQDPVQRYTIHVHQRKTRTSQRVQRVHGVHADDLARHRALVERMQFRGKFWERR